MKSLKLIIALVLCTFLLNCVTTHRVYLRKDNGNHFGWYKNPNNPHHPSHHNNTISLSVKSHPNHYNNGYNNGNNNGKQNGKHKHNKGKK